MILPIFISEHTILKSLLTLDDIKTEKGNVPQNSPISIFGIAKEHNIKELYLCDVGYSGFVSFYKNCEKYGINGRYGIQLFCCGDISQKDEASLNTEHKIIIWAGNTDSLKYLQKIYSQAYTDGFYYHGRTDLSCIKKLWHPNLILTIPFYDSFLFQNLMFFERNIVPEWGDLKPIFFLENHALPFDPLVEEAVVNYCAINHFETQKTHTICYYKNEDFYQYMILRCIDNRSKLSKPNVNFLSSDKFSFESYLNYAGNK